MKPRIGIVGNLFTKDSDLFYHNQATYTFQGNIEAIVQAGGLPVVIPIQAESMAKDYFRTIDGLFLPGGQDVTPSLYGQEPDPLLKETSLKRDQFELALFNLAWDTHKPILGICRGVQLINVALGGTLYQDQTLMTRSVLVEHDQAPEIRGNVATHEVQVEGELQKILGKEISVNSLHHQMIAKLAQPLKKVAWADDGVIEAVQPTDADQPLLGIQWHPEMMLKRPEMRAIFTKYLTFFK
ncbi:gamma-glutamyl-gamma-aminobutyrate hydrolase family protein [Pediococcus ethanolidurans]|uniref:gamma-glutamyl-gamma-aminobutyrate hydrolase family protein n=1 Tax=Pediococcus ethanolidurans TaxID=319653 RepID=UPI001C1F01EB|nr:gamma-glutamyl-gamma-aminobutyrate hydrolase family protein [Pediococcus ethanolidurans]MBU7555219.1 gamma-glutamyl-gamma-aminobutyrate hydrolase family protein [Pediococcus ethanolidurans]MBU7563500.1 gamma-glutamyl-gamma-aminobutyrate hydrolase family protein [Pediococcus ethanolidurans]MCV3315741.1 gamma-glutamyl-gamma-aminobutyrate hydrolase family protein [Pediococcus ethanolidurans]MCV3321997.1 gamma-glutamyl-gamma-aminobutyrate hydrolase family protein [Pediococcus ethanolidurans]MCV